MRLGFCLKDVNSLPINIVTKPVNNIPERRPIKIVNSSDILKDAKTTGIPIHIVIGIIHIAIPQNKTTIAIGLMRYEDWEDKEGSSPRFFFLFSEFTFSRYCYRLSSE